MHKNRVEIRTWRKQAAKEAEMKSGETSVGNKGVGVKKQHKEVWCTGLLGKWVLFVYVISYFLLLFSGSHPTVP